MADVKMVYPEMETMAHVFAESANELDEMASVMLAITAQLADGGLIGMAGNELVEAIRAQLNPSLGRMRDKMSELEKDIVGAVEFTRDGVQSAASRFV